MLPAITELFKTSFDESLKKLVAPAGLVPAAIFVLLNVVGLYPLELDEKLPVAIAFKSLDSGWQALIVTAAIIAIGYVTLSLSSEITRVFTGELLRGTALHDPLVAAQDRAYKRLNDAEDAAKADDKTDEAARIRAERETRFADPPFGDEKPTRAPTALGNAFNAASWAIWTGYRIDLSALLEHLRLVLAKQDEKTLAAIDEQRTYVDTLLHMTALLLVFLGECLILSVAHATVVLAPWAVGATLVAYGLYRAAVVRAIAWGDTVEAAIDLHRDKLADALKLKSTDKLDQERKVWEKASHTLLWVMPVSGPWTPATESRPTVVASSNVTVTPLAPFDSTRDDALRAGASHAWLTRHVLLVAASDRDRLAQPAFRNAVVAVSDNKVPRISGVSMNRAWCPAGVATAACIDRGKETDAVRWTISGLADGDAISLDYEIETMVSLVLDAPVPDDIVVRVLSAFEGDNPIYKFSITVTRPTFELVTARLRDYRPKPPSELHGYLQCGAGVPQEKTVAKVAEGAWTIPLGALDRDTYTLRLR